MTLLDYCRIHGITEEHAFKALWLAGIISDNCVTLKDVAVEDQQRAIDHLDSFPHEAPCQTVPSCN
jgi:hypothetical protein